MNGNDVTNQDNGLSHIKDKPPPAKPKPKPAGKRLHIQATGNSSNNSSPIRLPPSKFKTTVNGISDNETNQEEDPDDITLNPDSLAQFAQIDLDAVKRYNMLDSAAQRQKVYLGYGKGLQNRRLPSHISSKVGDDYYQKRKSYDPKVLLDSKPPVETRGRSGTELTSTVPLQAERENISPEEKQKEIMNKIGVPPQGTALAGLASIFKKGSATKKLQRSASSSSRDRATPPQVKVKPSKKLSDTNSPNLSRIKNDPNGSPSIRSSFKNKLFKKKKSKLSRGSSTDDMGGSTDDLWSETSSLSSISRISIREEDAFEGNFPRNKESPQHTEKTPPSTKIITSPSREPPLSKTSHEEHPSLKSPTITSTPLLPKEDTSLLSSPSRGKDRSDSLFKDMSDMFNDKDNLFDTAELSSLLAKTKSEFGADAEENAPQEEVKVPSPKKPSVTTKPKPKISIVTEEPKAPSKPMRKNRSRVLDTSMYDKAAENAIKSVTERKVEKENKKELERKKEEEKKKPKIALFEELDDEDDLFSGKKETQVEEKDTKKSVNKDDLFDDQDELEKPASPSVLREKPPKPEVSVDSALSTTKPDVQVSSDKPTKDKTFEIIKPEEGVKPADEIARPDELAKPDKQVNTDEPAEKPIEQAKSDSQAESKTSSSLFDDLDEEKAKKDEETMKSLFGDESENFVSNISGSAETSTKDSITNKDASKKADMVELKKPEIQVIKPVVVVKKPSITSPTRKELSPPPVKTKPPVLSVKPKPKRVVVKTAENEHQKEIKSDIKKEEEPVKIVESAKVESKEKEPTKDGENFKTAENKNEQVEKEDLKTNKDESKIKVDEDEKQKVETVSEEKEDEKKEAQSEKDQVSNEPEVKEKDKNAKDVQKDDSKPIPEWKKKLEEKRLQREKEERDTALKLEERKKKRDENKLANKDQVKPSAVSPKPVKKPMVPKDKPKPTPITSTTTITLSSKSTTEKEKSPVSPSGTPPPATKELSPSLDPSIPKWKQNLLAKKKQTEGTVQPTSPRKTSSVSVTVKKNDESLPAWKKDLLAKKKAVGEGGTKSTSSPKPGRSAAKDQPVPEFMKEFKSKRKA